LMELEGSLMPRANLALAQDPGRRENTKGGSFEPPCM